MRTVRYLNEAANELLHEIEYFTQVSPALGRRFDEEVRRAEYRLINAPEAGSPYKFGTRRIFPGKFKFSIVYLARPGEIVVAAIAPFSRRPGYWRSRAQRGN